MSASLLVELKRPFGASAGGHLYRLFRDLLLFRGVLDINNDGIVEVPWSNAVPGISAGSREDTRCCEYRALQNGSYTYIAC